MMSEIARVYAPGRRARGQGAARMRRPPAQVWLISPDRQLLTVLGEDYVRAVRLPRRRCRRRWPPNWRRCWHQRLPEKSALSVADSLTRRWSGPEIFLIIDDAEKLPPGLDSPLEPLAQAANVRRGCRAAGHLHPRLRRLQPARSAPIR